MPIHILVIDDEVLVQKLIKSRFRDEIRTKDFTFHYALDGKEALERLDQNPEIDILLCDINMPGMDGLTLLSKLKESDRILRTIMVTAYGNMNNIRAAMNQGAFDFITKPIDFSDLKTTIQKAIDELTKVKAGEEARKQLPITQKELEETGERARYLEKLDQLKSHFFANISHEFRTPLTVIRGMIEQMVENPDQWFGKGANMIRRNADQLLDLVNQILDLQKLEAGKLQLNMVQEDIIAFLKYLAEAFQVLAGQKDINLSFHSDNDEIWMDYDPEKILRVFTNLVSNAIKFTPRGGKIDIKINHLAESNLTSEKIQINVQDTGIGIPEEKLASIFDRFYQVDDSTTREGEGTGIGLSLTQELVDLMSGEIKVTSTLGSGTHFTILLPITREASSENHSEINVEKVINVNISKEKPNIAEGFAQNDEVPRLLIIEDNPDIVEYLVSCLENEYSLIIARDGQEGIEKAFELTPDLIISDVMMPHKDGFEVCDTLKKDDRTSHIPIVLLTAKTDEASRIQGLRKGADAYLGKPFNKEELFIRLEKLIELRQRLQNRYKDTNVLELPTSEEHTKEDEFLQKVCATIDQLMDTYNVNVPAICKEMGVSRSNLHRKVKALTGESSSSFIHKYRLSRAADLLKFSEETISGVAFKLGYSDPTYFTKLFSREYGISPREMRKSVTG